MTLSKEAQDAVSNLKKDNEQWKLRLFNIIDNVQTIDVLTQHALQDIRQVKDLKEDKKYLFAATHLLETIETISKDYR